MKLAIVIPTYNEAETIPSLIKELFEKIKQLVEKLDILYQITGRYLMIKKK